MVKMEEKCKHTKAKFHRMDNGVRVYLCPTCKKEVYAEADL